MKEKIEAVLAGRANEYAVIPVKDLVFAPELRKACESNVCGHFNSSWTCPPASGTVEELKTKIFGFKNAFIFTTKYQLEDSFDYEGMTKARVVHIDLTMELRNALGNEIAVYGAGSCPYCEPCAFPEPCRFPEKAITSMEAAGINVSALSFVAGIKYNNGPSTVTYFSMALF
jgi:predicted metal-binding protein